jgi:hypothetical protein
MTDTLPAEQLLPAGPGLRVRWLVAVPLMLVAVALPAFAQLAIGAWTSLSFQDSLPDFGDSGPDPTFWSEFRHDLGAVGPTLILPGVVLLVYLLRRSVFATWPMACLWLSLWTLAPMVLLGWAMDAGDARLPNLALGVGVVWLTYELGRLTLWVLSRPIAKDIGLSGLEIPYAVPGSRARLRVRRDHVRLDRLRNAGKGSTRRVIRWADLDEVRVDNLDKSTSWEASSRTRIDVPAGPALRIVGRKEEWLLPVTESTGEDLVGVIALRVHNRS